MIDAVAEAVGSGDHDKHGLNALKTKVQVAGLVALDRRTVAARALLDWRRDLVADLGGEAAVSAQGLSLAGLEP